MPLHSQEAYQLLHTRTSLKTPKDTLYTVVLRVGISIIYTKAEGHSPAKLSRQTHVGNVGQTGSALTSTLTQPSKPNDPHSSVRFLSLRVHALFAKSLKRALARVSIFF